MKKNLTRYDELLPVLAALGRTAITGVRAGATKKVSVPITTKKNKSSTTVEEPVLAGESMENLFKRKIVERIEENWLRRAGMGLVKGGSRFAGEVAGGAARNLGGGFLTGFFGTKDHPFAGAPEKLADYLKQKMANKAGMSAGAGGGTSPALAPTGPAPTPTPTNPASSRRSMFGKMLAKNIHYMRSRNNAKPPASEEDFDGPPRDDLSNVKVISKGNTTPKPASQPSRSLVPVNPTGQSSNPNRLTVNITRNRPSENTPRVDVRPSLDRLTGVKDAQVRSPLALSAPQTPITNPGNLLTYNGKPNKPKEVPTEEPHPRGPKQFKARQKFDSTELFGNKIVERFASLLEMTPDERAILHNKQKIAAMQAAEDNARRTGKRPAEDPVVPSTNTDIQQRRAVAAARQATGGLAHPIGGQDAFIAAHAQGPKLPAMPLRPPAGSGPVPRGSTIDTSRSDLGHEAAAKEEAKKQAAIARRRQLAAKLIAMRNQPK